MNLSIIIPSYNEPTVTQVLRKLFALEFPDFSGREIILVDDGSTDGSIAEAEKKVEEFPGLVILKHSRNMGKGAAIKTALQRCSGDIVIIQDADLEYDPAEIIKVITPIRNNETLVCYGSRHLDKSRRKKYLFVLKKHFGHSLLAFLGGRLITAVCNLLYGAKLTDVLTCFKAFSGPLIRHIDLECTGFDLEAELTVKVLKKTGIKEVAIDYFPRSRSEGKKIRFADGFKSLMALIRYRFIN